MKHFNRSINLPSLLVFLASIIFLADCLAVDPEGDTPEIKSDRIKIRYYLSTIDSVNEIKAFLEGFSKLPSAASRDQREDALNRVRLSVEDVSDKQDKFVVYASGTKFPEKVKTMVQPLVAALSSKSFINQRAELTANLDNADISQLKRIYELFLTLPVPSKEDVLYCKHYGLTSLNSR